MVAPVVSITKPTNGSTFTAGGEIYMLAQASDSDGSITKVEFFAGTKLLTTENSAPYECRWSGAPAGNYTLTAKATDNSGAVTTSAPIQISVQTSTWKDTIINADGTFNATEYARVAKEADLNYKFGPAYSYFHPVAESFPTISGGHTRSDGWILINRSTLPASTEGWGDWYAAGGNVCYRPDSVSDPGMNRAAPFSTYTEEQGGTSTYWRACHVQTFWNKNLADASVVAPDPSQKNANWLSAGNGTVPGTLVDINRARVKWAIGGVVVYSNGLVGITGTGNDRIFFPCFKLPAGKVPTAVTVSANSEFAFITIWDTVNIKGQLAVIALKGEETENDGVTLKHPMYRYYGLPSNLNGRNLAMKLLGYIDLNIKAPTSVTCGIDVSRWDLDRMYFYRTGTKEPNDLSTQAVRDKFLKEIDSYHRIARRGYVAVASRSENKIALVDIAPLLSYFRNTYLTSQASYDTTKNVGQEANQWPFAFSYKPESKPVVRHYITVDQPTALLSGFEYAEDSPYKNKLYVGTLEKGLLTYNVGSYLTVTPTAPTLLQTQAVGKNITHLHNGRNSYRENDIWITCRGDRTVLLYKPADNSGAGAVVKVLRDSRLVDPVSVYKGYGRGPDILAVCDHNGKKIVSYMASPLNFWGYTPYGLGSDGKADFEYTLSTAIPGKPMYFSAAEVT